MLASGGFPECCFDLRALPDVGMLERRCVDGRNGASWQAATFHRLYERLDREDALREMTVRYRDLMHSNDPVHTWPAD